MSAASKDLRVPSQIALPKGEEGMWMMMQKLDEQGTWSIADIATFAGNRPNVVREYVVRLEKAGYVRVVEAKKQTSRGLATLFEIARPSLLAPRVLKDGTVRREQRIETMWRTIRMLKRFTILELAGYIETDDEPANIASVRTYVCLLAKAGIVAREGDVPNGSWQPFRLVKVLGPKAPRILAANIVFDPNAKVTLGVAETREVAL